MGSIYAMKLSHLYKLWDESGAEQKYRSFSEPGNKFAIYGAGNFGMRMLASLKQQFNVTPIAFLDQKAYKGRYYVDKIPVFTPEELFALEGDIPIGVAVQSYYTQREANDIDERLRLVGFNNVMNIWTTNTNLNEFHYMPTINREKTVKVIDLLSDEMSKEQYYSYIYSRMWKAQFFAQIFPITTSYCETSLFQLGDNDYVLDCGAYNGYTAMNMLHNYPMLKYITMFEPDASTYKKLAVLVQETNRTGINAIQAAVTNVTGCTNFLNEGTEASRIDESSEEMVKCYRIDDLEYQRSPSFIKMDIEGAELSALHGARKTIVKYRPILAVSCYHKAIDIYEIPLFVNTICPDYRLFFRKYGSRDNSVDFVLYAIPPERVL